MNQKLLASDQRELGQSGSRAAGAELARPISFEGHREPKSSKRVKATYVSRIQARDTARENLRLLNENLRLIRTAEKEVNESPTGLRLPLVRDPAGVERPRVDLIARAYLNHARERFDEDTCAAFVEGFQNVTVLEMSELWALKPALERELLERLAATLTELH